VDEVCEGFVGIAEWRFPSCVVQNIKQQTFYRFAGILAEVCAAQKLIKFRI